MFRFGRFTVICVAVGLTCKQSTAFDKEEWSLSCQRAIKSVEACQFTDTFVRFSCDRAVREADTPSSARQNIEVDILSACAAQNSRGAGRRDQSASGLDRPGVGAPCVITTACTGLCGLSDGCFELAELRKFRQRFLQTSSDHSTVIAVYYNLSPSILVRLTNREDGARILAKAYAFYILPAALLAAARLDPLCLSLYRRGIRFLDAAVA